MRPDVVVAPDGDDRAIGTVAAPFASLAAARDQVRRLLAAGRTAPLTVYLRGGTYELAAPVEFGPADGGHGAVTVTYAAWPGETPVLSGGRRIGGWTCGPSGIWTTEVPEVRSAGWNFRSLFVGGQRRTLARTPNSGWFRADEALPDEPKRGLVCATADLPAVTRGRRAGAEPSLFAQGEVVLPIVWTGNIVPLAGIDPLTRALRLARPLNHAMAAGQRYVLQGLSTDLDAPGEWQLDRYHGVLSYIPLPGEDPRQVEIIAPRADALLRITGTGEQPVAGLRFSGLQFAYTDDALPANGFVDDQGSSTVPAVISLTAARDCVIERCTVAHIGTYAIEVAAGCRDIRIERNELHDLGAGGVIVRQGSAGTTIDNNFIHDGGCVYLSGTPVLVQDSSGNAITHNEICDFNWMGICVGWSWGFQPTQCHDNRIEFNHLHHLGRGVLTDLGGIYTLGISTGTVIRNNVIHHVWDCPEGYLACGIYPDEGSSGLLIENNVVYQTAWGGLHVHYGRDNVIRNNIFAFGRSAQIQMGRNKGPSDGANWRDVTRSGMTFERNLVLYERGDLYRRDSDLVADRNLYWNSAGAVVFPGGAALAAWRALGRDQHALIADPRFVAAAAGDFRLLPDSPAVALGFVPIDTSTVGLSGEPEWVTGPKLVTRPPTVIPPAEQLGVQRALSDDFEATPVGALPHHAEVNGATGDGWIRVSADTAASGTHSLKFQDAPGLANSWDPHLVYRIEGASGVAQASFALRLEPGAYGYHEWRDWSAGSYIAGPSLWFNPDGALVANGTTLLTVPHGQWLHITIACALGARADGTYTLTVQLPGKEPAVFHCTCDRRFNHATWLGFVSMATDARVFYLDEVVWGCR